jgi:hypothetical protein
VKNSPIFTTKYLHTEGTMDDIKTEEKKYVGSVLKFEDKSDEEDLEATLAELRKEKEMIMKRNKKTTIGTDKEGKVGVREVKTRQTAHLVVVRKRKSMNKKRRQSPAVQAQVNRHHTRQKLTWTI